MTHFRLELFKHVQKYMSYSSSLFSFINLVYQWKLGQTQKKSMPGAVFSIRSNNCADCYYINGIFSSLLIHYTILWILSEDGTLAVALYSIFLASYMSRRSFSKFIGLSYSGLLTFYRDIYIGPFLKFKIMENSTL